jgi:hypothetical protein
MLYNVDKERKDKHVPGFCLIVLDRSGLGWGADESLFVSISLFLELLRNDGLPPFFFDVPISQLWFTI